MLTQEEFFENFLKKELSNRGIDISDDKYYQNAEFKKLHKEYVIGKIAMPTSWWIEKHIVGQERLKRIYGIYALGVEHEFSEKELKNSVWMKELADRYCEMKIGKADGVRTQKDVEQYFYRKECNRKDGRDECGLIERLRRLGFDVDRFDGPKAREERVKLLYFLFGFEFKYKVKITPFLSLPSFENIDNNIVGDKTRNGELMAYLKNNIMKEIDENYIRALKDTIDIIIDRWESQIMYVRDAAIVKKDMKLLDDIHSDLQWILNQLKEDPVRYRDSLLESFYLKIMLHEMIGREKELVDISDTSYIEKVEINEFQREKINEFELKTIEILGTDDDRYNTVVQYIKDHRKNLAQCVFGRATINSNDYRRFDRATDGIKHLLDFYRNNTKTNIVDCVPVVLVISYMQVYIFENEKINSVFYRHESKDKVTYRTEIDNGADALRRSQYALLEKVKRRYFANSGRQDVNIKLKEAEKCLDTFLLYVYSSNSLMQLKINAWLLLTYIETFVDRRIEVERRFNCLVDFLNGDSFELWACDSQKIYLFLRHLDNGHFCTFMNEIGNLIADTEDNTYISTYDIEQDDLYTDDFLEAFMEMDISISEKKIEVVNGGIRFKNSL